MSSADKSEHPPKRQCTEPSGRTYESDVGLLAYVHPGWRPVHAIIKQRYADFIVHELAADGRMVSITSLDPPPVWDSKKPQGSWDDLRDFFGDRLSDVQAGCLQGPVDSCVLTDKSHRTHIHRVLRALAGDRLMSETIQVPEGSAVRVQQNTTRRSSRDDPDAEAAAAPPYIHFTLQKTNRDSQEALQWLARFLKLDHRGRASSVNALSVAGTKDKRAVTVQRVALQRGRRTLREVWDRVNHIGQPISSAPGQKQRRTVHDAVTTRAERGLRIAHLSYADAPLQFGMLRGNHFTITLRDVRWTDTATPSDDIQHILGEHVRDLEAHGFINYFGMQRFGTGLVSTHQVGIAVLRKDFREALRLVLEAGALHGDADEEDAPPAVLATRQAQAAVAEKRYEDAYRLMPKKGVAERAVLEKMKMPGWSPNDALGPFQNIPRSLRLMYVHAYQSYLWNRLVSERVARFGALSPVVGDLVQHSDESIHVLDAETVAQHSMDDVVMPMPGADVRLPQDGWLEQLYTDMLQQDGLTPDSLSSSHQPEYRLKGAYRRLIHKPRNLRCEFLTYADANAPLCATDEEALLGVSIPTQSEAPYLAMKLSFELPPSSYATVMLREILRTDTSAHVHKELTKQSTA